MTRPALVRIFGAAFAAAGVAFMVVALVGTWDRARGQVLPDWPLAVGAVPLVVLGLLAASRGWHSLVPSASHQATARAFYLAQLGKYIPGGVWQAAGQVGFTARAGVPAPRAAVAFPVHALTQVAAAGVLGAFLSVAAVDLPAWARASTLAGLAVVVLLRRGWMVGLLRLVRRQAPPDLVPPQRAILVSSAWSVATLLASGGAFALLVSDASNGTLVAVLGYALAWAVGFLALPFPSGLGVREAVLVAVVGPTAPVIAASIVHRLVTIAAEGVLVVWSRLR